MAEQEEKQDCAGGKNLHIYPARHGCCELTSINIG